MGSVAEQDFSYLMLKISLQSLFNSLKFPHTTSFNHASQGSPDTSFRLYSIYASNLPFVLPILLFLLSMTLRIPF